MAISTQLPVLIVGAGPTGLVLALWLRKKNIPFRIIDKSASPGETSRALGIQARTLEFYQQLGIASDILNAGIKAYEVAIRREGREVARARLGAMGEKITPFPCPIFLSQDIHENFLNETLEKLSVKIERRTELVGLVQDGQGVTATLKTPQGEEKVRSDYVCGCDGSHSVVRQEIGVGFPGGTYNQMFYVADVNATGEMAESGVQVSVSWEGFCIVMPIEKKNSVRLTGIIPKEKAKKDQITFKDVEDEVKRSTGLEVTNVNWFSAYHVHHRVADGFRKGRVFLAGDAGHIHSPAGAQGMNTGIGDAVNLAWKLAAVISKQAPEKLLETYEPERIAFARRLVRSTDTAFTIIASPSIVGSIWRTFFMPKVFALVAGTKSGLKLFFRTISQTSIRYRKSSLSEGNAGKVHAGDRLPWVRTSSGDNYAPLTSLDWQLHIYGEVERSFRTAVESKIDLHHFEWNSDMESKGFLKNAFYLIRPDGYIGMVGEQSEFAKLEGYIKKWCRDHL